MLPSGIRQVAPCRMMLRRAACCPCSDRCSFLFRMLSLAVSFFGDVTFSCRKRALLWPEISFLFLK